MSAKSDLVSLRPITAQSVRSVCSLTVAKDQEGFVAPNAVSLAQALFSPNAWYRAIYLAEQPVGFVMLEDESLLPTRAELPKVRLWRFMIDARFQGQGIGKASMLRKRLANTPRSDGLWLFVAGLPAAEVNRVTKRSTIV